MIAAAVARPGAAAAAAPVGAAAREEEAAREERVEMIPPKAAGPAQDDAVNIEDKPFPINLIMALSFLGLGAFIVSLVLLILNRRSVFSTYDCDNRPYRIRDEFRLQPNAPQYSFKRVKNDSDVLALLFNSPDDSNTPSEHNFTLVQFDNGMPEILVEDGYNVNDFAYRVASALSHSLINKTKSRFFDSIYVLTGAYKDDGYFSPVQHLAVPTPTPIESSLLQYAVPSGWSRLNLYSDYNTAGTDLPNGDYMSRNGEFKLMSGQRYKRMDSPRIALVFDKAFTSRESTLGILMHEIGHAIYHELLTTRQYTPKSEALLRQFNASINGDDARASRYAHTIHDWSENETFEANHEAFAEMFHVALMYNAGLIPPESSLECFPLALNATRDILKALNISS